MLLGPIFDFELRRAVRRPSFFRLRFAYGALLLFLVSSQYWALAEVVNRSGDVISIQSMAQFGDGAFATVVGLQAVGVLGMTPSLVSPVIVDERQRKTLHYLLASRLTSTEIVVGKLAARLLHVGLFLLMSLPIVSLLSLVGGVQPLLIVLAYGASMTTAFLVGAGAILVSNFAKSTRQASTGAFALMALWLIGPPILEAVLPSAWPAATPWLMAVGDWLGKTNPISAIAAINRTPAELLPIMLWFMGLQVVYGTVFVLIAIWQLRPSFRRLESQGARRRWLGRGAWKLRLFSRPPCGDDPMLWKEKYVTRTAGLTRVIALLLVVGLVGLLAYSVYLILGPAFAQNDPTAIGLLNMMLRGLSAGLYILLGFGMASAAAVSMAVEREEDTWVSLVTTPLDGAEILRAKVIGAAWTFRPILGLLAILWGIGVVVGAVHPVGAIAAAVAIGVYLWFAATVGVTHSLTAKTTGKAQNAAIGTLLLLNVGAGCLSSLVLPPQMYPMTFTPAVVFLALTSPQEVRALVNPASISQTIDQPMLMTAPNPTTALVAFSCVLSVVLCAAAAAYLTRLNRRRFDTVVDRPRRARYLDVPVFRRADPTG